MLPFWQLAYLASALASVLAVCKWVLPVCTIRRFFLPQDGDHGPAHMQGCVGRRDADAHLAQEPPPPSAAPDGLRLPEASVPQSAAPRLRLDDRPLLCTDHTPGHASPTL